MGHRHFFPTHTHTHTHKTATTTKKRKKRHDTTEPKFWNSFLWTSRIRFVSIDLRFFLLKIRFASCWRFFGRQMASASTSQSTMMAAPCKWVNFLPRQQLERYVSVFGFVFCHSVPFYERRRRRRRRRRSTVTGKPQRQRPRDDDGGGDEKEKNSVTETQ